CAQIDIALHNRVTEEKDRLEMTTSQYITQLLMEYYEMKENGGKSTMANNGSRTMAFQIPEELFQRIKTHLVRETARTGVKLTQRDFVLGLIEQALAEAEASLAPQEA
ncbi:translation initiation factor 2, partial [Pseudoflavonifractor phocaeensis]|uniref:translation initiation factor 2 n=1 Tax=Pseudoflavonifractor phocaeensis TaxID=1870988 RepID=UPI00195D4E76